MQRLTYDTISDDVDPLLSARELRRIYTDLRNDESVMNHVATTNALWDTASLSFPQFLHPTLYVSSPDEVRPSLQKSRTSLKKA